MTEHFQLGSSSAYWYIDAGQLCHFFFFNDTATTEIYTLSLHDALPICRQPQFCRLVEFLPRLSRRKASRRSRLKGDLRSEEHTSELPVTSASRMPSSA